MLHISGLNRILCSTAELTATQHAMTSPLLWVLLLGEYRDRRPQEGWHAEHPAASVAVCLSHYYASRVFIHDCLLES